MLPQGAKLKIKPHCRFIQSRQKPWGLLGEKYKLTLLSFSTVSTALVMSWKFFFGRIAVAWANRLKVKRTMLIQSRVLLQHFNLFIFEDGFWLLYMA
jgi:hypothetical protein